MELLTTAVIIILLTTTCAKPVIRHQHQDANIPDSDSRQELLDGNKMWASTEFSNLKGCSSESDESSESSESCESSESQSSEEVPVTREPVPDLTTAATSSPFMTTAAMTVVTVGDMSTLTLEPDEESTDGPIVTTSLERIPSTLSTTLPTNGTHCFTEEFPTGAPITERRGDS